MIKVLGRQTSGNVQKVLFVLEEAGHPLYARGLRHASSTTRRRPNTRRSIPNGKVPTLIDGDTVIWESNTILRYLADTHAKALTGATPAERTEVERWMDWLLASINPLYLTVFKDAKKPAAERVSDYDAQAKELVSLLTLADAHLAGRACFALGRLTLADIALGPIVSPLPRLPDRLAGTCPISKPGWRGSRRGRPSRSRPARSPPPWRAPPDAIASRARSR